MASETDPKVGDDAAGAAPSSGPLAYFDSNAPTVLSLAALQTVLTHGSEFLTSKELGRFSVSSKEALVMTSDSWKRIFERVAEIGAC